MTLAHQIAQLRTWLADDDDSIGDPSRSFLVLPMS